MISNIHLFYSVTIIILLGATIAYLTRHHWISHLPNNPFARWFYTRLPSSFAADIESGFSSSHFDLHGNVADGDSRAGLNDTQKAEIRKIMKARRVDFDEARRIFTEANFARNGIGPDGRPRDPKFVSFS